MRTKRLEAIRNTSTLRLLAAVIVLGSMVGISQAFYDASTDFSITNGNPNGVWSYGYSTTLGGTYVADSFTVTPLTGLDGWTADLSGTKNPSVMKNTTNGALAASTARWAPFQMTMHPGPTGEYSVLRFTAPSTGLFNFVAAFIGQDVVGTTTDVHVLKNNGVLWSSTVNGYLNTTSKSSSVALAVGDTLDVAVGPNTGGYFFDTTGVEFTVNPVPEPMTMALGFTCLGLALNRRRARR